MTAACTACGGPVVIIRGARVCTRPFCNGETQTSLAIEGPANDPVAITSAHVADTDTHPGHENAPCERDTQREYASTESAETRATRHDEHAQPAQQREKHRDAEPVYTRQPFRLRSAKSGFTHTQAQCALPREAGS